MLDEICGLSLCKGRRVILPCCSRSIAVEEDVDRVANQNPLICARIHCRASCGAGRGCLHATAAPKSCTDVKSGQIDAASGCEKHDEERNETEMTTRHESAREEYASKLSGSVTSTHTSSDVDRLLSPNYL